MSEIIKIANDKISAEISTFGAEFKSIKVDGKEILWDGNPDVWSGQAPIMFPICGGLKDGKFMYEGKKYSLSKHGFAKLSEFAVEEKTTESAVFLLRANAETLEKYPFEFEFRVRFKLNGDTIDIDYAVKNIGTKNMYYYTGAHEAYDCPEGIEAYSVIFEKDEKFLSNKLGKGTILREKERISEPGREISLKREYFSVDAIILSELNSRKVWLKNNLTGKNVVEVTFNDFDSLLLWTKPSGQYICIEPWTSVTNFVDNDMDITKKSGIIEIAAGSEKIHRHSLKFQEQVNG